MKMLSNRSELTKNLPQLSICRHSRFLDSRQCKYTIDSSAIQNKCIVFHGWTGSMF